MGLHKILKIVALILGVAGMIFWYDLNFFDLTINLFGEGYLDASLMFRFCYVFKIFWWVKQVFLILVGCFFLEII